MTRHKNLDYLNGKPYTIKWKVITPKNARLTVLQDHDLIYDDKDFQIRGILSEPKGSEKIRGLI